MKTDEEATWPNWLQAMKTTHADQVATALDPQNWNWALAWADPAWTGGNSYDRALIDKDKDLRLRPNEKLVQAVFLMEMYCPSAGWTPIQPDMMINVEFNGLTLSGGIPGSIGHFGEVEQEAFASDYRSGDVPGNGNLWVGNRLNFSAVWGGRNYGGGGGFRSLMRGVGRGANPPAKHRAYIKGGVAKGDGTHQNYNRGWASGRRAWFDTGAADVEATNIYPFVTRPFKVDSANSITVDGGEKVVVTILANRTENPANGKADPASVRRFTSTPKAGPTEVQTIELDLSQLSGMPVPHLSGATVERRNEFDAIYTRETSPMEWWSASFDGVNPLTASHGRLACSNRTPHGVGQFIRDGDTVWTMVQPHGDTRLVAGLRKVPHPSSVVEFVPHPEAGGNDRYAHSLTMAVGGNRFPGVSGANITDQNYHPGKKPLPIPGGDQVRDTHQLYGDFDNGQGGTIDGAYINKADEGNTHSLRQRTLNQSAGSWEWRRDYGSYPYFVREWTHEPSGPAYFSPNRMMPSPVMFGSMPNMVLNNSGRPTKGRGRRCCSVPMSSATATVAIPARKVRRIICC